MVGARSTTCFGARRAAPREFVYIFFRHCDSRTFSQQQRLSGMDCVQVWPCARVPENHKITTCSRWFRPRAARSAPQGELGQPPSSRGQKHRNPAGCLTPYHRRPVTVGPGARQGIPGAQFLGTPGRRESAASLPNQQGAGTAPVGSGRRWTWTTGLARSPESLCTVWWILWGVSTNIGIAP